MEITVLNFKKHMPHYLAGSRLIVSNKLPGVRPIGVGEVSDRFLGKILASVTGHEVRSQCNSDQLCSGIKGGIKGAIHGIQQLFEMHFEDGLLLVYAANAFHSLSRSAPLWNSRILWTSCSRFLFNSYQGFAVLIIRGTDEFIYNREGWTQGDQLGMLFYAVCLLPLTHKLKAGSTFVKELKKNQILNNEASWKQIDMRTIQVVPLI